MAPSSRWNFAIVASSRFFFQLNDGEQLYASILPGNFAWIASANAWAKARSGLPVSHQMRSAYGAYASPRATDWSRPLRRLVEAFHRALAGQERTVDVVDVRGHEVGRFRVGAREDDRGHAHAVGGEPRRHELVHGLARGHEHLAAHVAALLHRGQLVLEVHAGRARLDHRLHELEGIEHAAEARFRIRDDRREEIGVARAFHVLDLVGARERAVDPLDHGRHRVDRVQRLVGIHLARHVGVRRDLPAGQVDRFQARLHLLHRLVAAHRAQRVDEGLLAEEPPQLLGAAAGQRVLDVDGAAEPHDLFGGIAALDALPAGIFGPVLLEACCFEVVVHCGAPRSSVWRCAGGAARDHCGWTITSQRAA